MDELKSIGRYHIEAPLFQSATSNGYRAKDTVLNRTVTLRVFKQELLKKSRTRSRLLESLQLAADLVHPHIIWVWDLGEIDGHIYSAERFIEGKNLDELLIVKQRKSWEQALPAFRQIAQAVQFAHQRDVIHGNIDPSSLVLSADLGAALSGFGLFQVFYPDQELTKFSDQAGLARLLISMVSGRADLPGEFDLEEFWPLSAPRLVIKALGRALGFTDEWQYPSVEEFASDVNRLAGLPQPTLSLEEIERLEEEETQWQKAREEARQAAEQAARQEALEAARREINEQIQLTRDNDSDEVEQLSPEETDNEESPETQPSSFTSKETAGESASIPGEDAMLAAENVETDSTDVQEDDEITQQIETPELHEIPAPQSNNVGSLGNKRKILWIFLILLAILAVVAITWVILNGFVLPVF